MQQYYAWVHLKYGYKLQTIEPIKVQVKEQDKKEEKEEEYSSAFENMMKTLHQMTIGKLMSGSGQARIEGERLGMDLLKHSPIFGIGLGSYRTFSLFTNTLLNMGIFGALSLLYMLFVPINALIKYRKKDEAMSVMLLIAIIGTAIAFFVGVPDLTYTFYWMFLIFGYKYATIKEK